MTPRVTAPTLPLLMILTRAKDLPSREQLRAAGVAESVHIDALTRP